MKLRALALAVSLFGGAMCLSHGQNVTLGDSTFDAESDQMPADWYYPMAVGTKSYTGYGDNAGHTRTETFSREVLGGVKCIK